MKKILISLIISSFIVIQTVESQNVTLSHCIVNDSIYFIFSNIGSDTAFLFSTYFDYTYRNAKIFHKINQRKEYKISFLPLTNYLVKEVEMFPDVLHGLSDKIFYRYENLYTFIPINPKDSLVLDFSFITLFNNDKLGNIAYKDYNNLTILRKDLKPLKRIKRDYEQIIFEFALYNKNSISKKIPLSEFVVVRDYVKKNPRLLHIYAFDCKENYKKTQNEKEANIDGRDFKRNKLYIRSLLNQ